MRILSVLLLAAVLAARESDLKPLLERALEGDEAARKDLIQRGQSVIPAIETLIPKLALERQAQARAFIEEIKRQEILKKISFSVGMPKMALTTALVNSKDFRFNLCVRNKSEKELVLWPFFKLEILDKNGNHVPPTSRRGRFGFRRGGTEYYLEDVKFQTIQPNKRWTTSENIRMYMRDPAVITGFQLPGPGTYTLVFTYEYHRRDKLKHAPKTWKAKDDPTKPWNRALELRHTFKQTITVH